MENLRQHIYNGLIQVSVWLLLFVVPLLIGFFTTFSWLTALGMFVSGLNILVPVCLVYTINYLVLVPKLLHRQHLVWMVVVNIVLINVCNVQWIMLIPKMEFEGEMRIYYFMYLSLIYVINVLAVFTAAGMRNRRRLQEEKQKSTEAELAWLKNQINPHFLFNTLNNISSLTQIDPDQAQDSIAQLSDLLRYAMYETNKPQVPIQGEVAFMRNYIDLMKLRCNEKAEVDAQFTIQNPDLSIAPLLFISLIENAFKHGLSSSRPSKIDITLEQADNQIIFTCDNTNYPKTQADRSGSGIGVENTRRRLNLLYLGRYQWEQTLNGDIYHVRITLQL